jgi:hypothetical protein
MRLKKQCWLPAAAACALATAIGLSSAISAAPPDGSTTDPSAPNRRPLLPRLRLADRSEATRTAPAAAVPTQQAQAGEHPLTPVIRWARNGLGNIENIHDYSSTVVKRERIGGKLSDYQFMFIKLRQKPFSVYMYFLKPDDVRGREVIYVEGQNNGRMLAHGVGAEAHWGTVSLKPDGLLAMRNQRYPLTELGILNMTRHLIQVGEDNMRYGECEVKYYDAAKVNGRTCTMIEVIHPFPRRNFLFNVARIFVDKELNLPIRYESYDWPKQQGGPPELMEEYTYSNLKLNNGFTDADFSIKNPNYSFR